MNKNFNNMLNPFIQQGHQKSFLFKDNDFYLTCINNLKTNFQLPMRNIVYIYKYMEKEGTLICFFYITDSL